MDAIVKPKKSRRIAKQGVSAGIPKSAVTFFIADDLIGVLKEVAAAEDRSVTTQIVHYVRRGLAQDSAALTKGERHD